MIYIKPLILRLGVDFGGFWTVDGECEEGGNGMTAEKETEGLCVCLGSLNVYV